MKKWIEDKILPPIVEREDISLTPKYRFTKLRNGQYICHRRLTEIGKIYPPSATFSLQSNALFIMDFSSSKKSFIYKYKTFSAERIHDCAEILTSY